MAKNTKPAKLSRDSKPEKEETKEETAGIENGENGSETPRLKQDKKQEDSKGDEEVDYLLKYQYGREMPLGDPRSNPRDGKALTMKNALLAQAKVRVMIPVDSGSDPSVPFDVTLNGYRLSLPRNEYIDVPEQIAEVIMNSHNQTNAAINQFKIGGNKNKEDALS